MQKVLGFGGFFFRARDPIGLAQWYEDHLGINIAPTNMEMRPWESESGVREETFGVSILRLNSLFC